jgi:hypothetical protein
MFGGALAAPAFFLRRFTGFARAGTASLRSVSLDLSGDWGNSSEATAALVVSRMREVSLSRIALLSDRQPQRLDVDAHTSGYPHIELDHKPTDAAFIAVDVGTRAWAQLAYQFGHELGHVLCNSWAAGSAPQPPCQWLEEAMVEAFSLRGLGRLADSWAREPPIAGSAAYGPAIRTYRDNQVARYRTAAGSEPTPDLPGWFRANRGALDGMNGLYPVEGPAIVAILGEFEGDSGCVADLGAVNRWPQRSAVPIEQYLRLWQASCAEIKSPGRMPGRLRAMLGVE